MAFTILSLATAASAYKINPYYYQMAQIKADAYDYSDDFDSYYGFAELESESESESYGYGSGG